MYDDYDGNKLGDKIFSQRNVYEVKRIKIVDKDISDTLPNNLYNVSYFIESAELHVRRRHDDGETPENILFLHLRAQVSNKTREERITFPLAGKDVYGRFMNTYGIKSIEELIHKEVKVYYVSGKEKNVKGISC